MEAPFHATEPLSIPAPRFLASAFPPKGPWLRRDPRGSPGYDGKIGNIIYIYISIFFLFFKKKGEKHLLKRKKSEEKVLTRFCDTFCFFLV